MILYIAEKPSLGRALVQALPKPHTKADGYITVGNGDVVSWCIGHLLEQADPDAYNAAFKKWSLEHLPIVPEQWQLTVKPKTRRQFSVLKKLIKQADTLVNVGDPDREGQILIDEVIQYCGTPKAKIDQAKRCLISDLNLSAVKRALNNLKNNRDFIPLAASALARARADWLYGMNMTRLCTLQGQQSGYQGVLSIGRVQTPLLGLVVRRDKEISQFVSKPFYELIATVAPKDQATFNAKWVPSEACRDYMDEDKRVLSRPLVENVKARIIGKSGEISRFKRGLKHQAAPLPFNLSSLQIDAAKVFGLSAQQVLDSAQQLYEKHKLITYPRSDCRYIPEEHFNDASKVISAIQGSMSSLTPIAKQSNTKQKNKAWNNKKISAHHAIIPTTKTANTSNLTPSEQKLYELIARQYLMQFLPSFDYEQVEIDCRIEGGLFTCKQKFVKQMGWKNALLNAKHQADKHSSNDDFSSNPLPELHQGQTIFCQTAKIIDKNTTPPKHFNDASLIAAMTGIARYVNDNNIKKILRDTQGIGTDATRANIIELLFKRGFLQRKGKEIWATDIGRELIDNLPDCITLPDMTAQWEAQLESISQKELAYVQFMQPMTHSLTNLIKEVRQVSFHGLKGKGKPPKKRRARKKRAA